METLFFLLFAGMTVGGSIATVWMKYVVHSAFALMAAFIGIAGLFLMLGADFLAVAQILIYVGGILVLFLFGIMLTPPDRRERNSKRVLSLGLPVLAIVLFVALQIGAVVKWIVRPEIPPPGPTAESIGKALLNPTGYLIPFELISVVLLVALIGSVFIARRKKMTAVDDDSGQDRATSAGGPVTGQTLPNRLSSVGAQS